MKDSRRVLVLGDYSGRNVGHNALLVSILAELESLGESRCIVPTLRPSAIRRLLANRFRRVEVVGVGPATLSAKFLGYPTIAQIKQADDILLTDNLFHDRALFNPLRNNLFALVVLLRLCRTLGKRVTYYNSGVGPIESRLGRRLVSRLSESVDTLIVRDDQSLRLLGSLAPRRSIVKGADSGFNMPWERFGAAPNGGARERRIGVNLSPDIETWLANRFPETPARQRLCKLAAALSETAGAQRTGLSFLLTYPGDRALTNHVRRLVADGIDTETVDHCDCDFSEIAEQCGALKCVIGLRYHELVMYASAGVPVAGLDCGGKVRSLFEVLQCPENAIDTNLLASRDGPSRFAQAVSRACEQTSELRSRVVDQQGRARAASQTLAAVV